MPVDVRVTGEVEARRKVEQVVRDLKGEEFLGTLRHATLLVERDAKLNAPVDTGRLKTSITSEIRMPTIGQRRHFQGVIGSVVEYAPYQELGTGTFVGRAPHFPPPSALHVWARRHGLPSGYVAAAAVYRVGGIRPKRYLQRALEKNRPQIITMLDGAVGRIVRR